jgi:MFS transporter, YNFM family, putative membrane transport protein
VQTAVRGLSSPSLARPVAALSAAAFVAAATMRVADPLLPQIAHDFATTPGAASIVATAFALAYGLFQLAWGPLGDRYGKYLIVTITTAMAGLLVAAPALSGSLFELGLFRALGGMTAAAAIPLSMAFIGDHVAYDRRQAMIARFLTGQIMGVIAGQAFGGALGDALGWRAVFLVLGGLYLLVAVWLVLELRSGRLPAPVLAPARGPARLAAAYLDVLMRPWARIVLAAVFVEGALFYGGLAYIGAYAHEIWELPYTTVGLALAFFGLGGLAYAMSVGRLVRRLGERGLSGWGGVVMAAGFAILLAAPHPMALPVATALLGLGFYMLHNTLQTNATQMAPEMRGIAVSTFACSLFLGQAAGVALMGLIVDAMGYLPVFAICGAALTCVGWAFSALLQRRPAER